jgi:hypothetical protein
MMNLFAKKPAPRSALQVTRAARARRFAAGLAEIRSGRVLDPPHAAKWDGGREWIEANGTLISHRGRSEDTSFSVLKHRVLELQDSTGKRVVVGADGWQTLADRFRRPGDGENDALDHITKEWVDGWGEADVPSLLLEAERAVGFDASDEVEARRIADERDAARGGGDRGSDHVLAVATVVRRGSNHASGVSHGGQQRIYTVCNGSLSRSETST